MNRPARVIGFVNAAHFIDHYSMLIFAAAVIVMGPALGMSYSELLALRYAGIYRLWCRLAVDRLARRPLEPPPHDGDLLCRHRRFDDRGRSGAGPSSNSVWRYCRSACSASIYHPVGTAMIVSYARPARPRDGPQRRLG